MSYNHLAICHTPPSATTTYIKEDKSNNFNINNSTVTFNVTMPQHDAKNSADQLIAVQSFSKEYYQLIVTTAEDVFTNNIVSVTTDRALARWCVPSEIYDRCSSLSEEGIKELKTFPALICRENTDYHGITDPDQWAVYGYIKRIKKEYKTIKIAFCPLQVFPQQKLCEEPASVYFDLNMGCALTDLNHSAWSVHKVNLFEAFDIANISGMPRPS